MDSVTQRAPGHKKPAIRTPLLLAATLSSMLMPFAAADPNVNFPGAPTCHFGEAPTPTHGCPVDQAPRTGPYLTVAAGDSIVWDNDGAPIGGTFIIPDVIISVYDHNGVQLFTESIGLGDSQAAFVAPATPARTDDPFTVEWTDTLTGVLYATWTMCYPEIQAVGPLWLGNCPVV